MAALLPMHVESKGFVTFTLKRTKNRENKVSLVDKACPGLKMMDLSFKARGFEKEIAL